MRMSKENWEAMGTGEILMVVSVGVERVLLKFETSGRLNSNFVRKRERAS